MGLKVPEEVAMKIIKMGQRSHIESVLTILVAGKLMGVERDPAVMDCLYDLPNHQIGIVLMSLQITNKIPSVKIWIIKVTSKVLNIILIFRIFIDIKVKG